MNEKIVMFISLKKNYYFFYNIVNQEYLIEYSFTIVHNVSFYLLLYIILYALIVYYIFWVRM